MADRPPFLEQYTIASMPPEFPPNYRGMAPEDRPPHPPAIKYIEFSREKFPLPGEWVD